MEPRIVAEAIAGFSVGTELEEACRGVVQVESGFEMPSEN